MTTDNRFEYHKYLSRIAANDVEFLKKKDRSYGASWKSNGRSAWFMIKRMMDRLNAMMERPTPTHGFNLQNLEDTMDAIDNAAHVMPQTSAKLAVQFPGTKEATLQMLDHLKRSYLSEDLLATLFEESRNRDVPENEAPDGYVLSVVRDLRRYCLLAEAEILHRLGVPDDRTPTPKSVPLEDSNKHGGRTNYRGGKSTMNTDAIIVAYPWVVDSKWRFDNGYGESGRSEEFRRWWEPHSVSGMWRPRPYVTCDRADAPPAQLLGHYYLMTNVNLTFSQYVLAVEQVPTSMRSQYPKFRMECNMKELNDQRPEWGRLLYYKVSGDDKWRVKPDAEAWTSW